jgi:hypothetical protein
MGDLRVYEGIKVRYGSSSVIDLSFTNYGEEQITGYLQNKI